MAFKIPTGYERFANEVFARFRNLLDKNVFSGITKFTLREWESNFATDEERDPAAHLLDALDIKTNRPTVASTSQHVVEMVDPTIDRTGTIRIIDHRCVRAGSANGDTALGLDLWQFGTNLLASVPEKAEHVSIRHFSRAANIHRNLLW